MASELPPFMNSYGLVTKVLEKIKDAETPTRFTQDHLAKLGFGSGSAKPILPLLKRLGFLKADGAPSDLYTAFRNPAQSGGAMAQAIRQGYRALYEQNQNAHKLARPELEGLLVQVTGLQAKSKTLRAIYGTFANLKGFAVWDAAQQKPEEARATSDEPQKKERAHEAPVSHSRGFGMNLAYTINLNLPETDNIAVFNAIFQSLRENLLKQ